jgi:protein-S-isoprenylcysteine O-methyltransferase Ste14
MDGFMTLGFALALWFTVGWVPAYLCRVEEAKDALPHYSAVERRWVWLAMALFGVHMTAACTTVTLTRDISYWRALLALVVFAAGMGFWFWGRLSIGPLRVRRLPDQPPTRFRQDGPFRIVRHPLYLGILVAASAPVLVTFHAHLTVTLVACVMVLAVCAVQEERRLRGQLGSVYDSYCRNVKRLVPFVW